MTPPIVRDPWFWIALFFLSGWIWFLVFQLRRHYWRIPPELLARVNAVLNRPIGDSRKDAPIVYDSLGALCSVAVNEWLELLAELELEARGVPPSVFSARRRGLDS